MSELKPEDFQIGSVVTLKSGGPKMTVDSIELNILNCVYWNLDNKNYEYKSFDFGLLDKIE